MTEDEARSWLSELDGVSRETLEKLEKLAALVVEENARQNLIGAATVPHIWARHIADSAQLVPLAAPGGRWLDLGSGPGFPGLVTGLVTNCPTTLVESRRKRIEFLLYAVDALSAPHITVAGCRIESLAKAKYDTISARAFAPLPRLFELAHSFSTEKTLWLLPKGRSSREELESARATWQGEFHVKPSLTDPDAAIIVATNVRPKRRSR